MGLRRQAWGGLNLGPRGGRLKPPFRLCPPIPGRQDHKGAGQAGGRKGYQLVNHGVSIVTDFRIGLER